MVAVTALWLPILVSAVLVFVASSIIHMVLGYHANDFGRLPSEDRFREALRDVELPPGDFAIPHAGSAKAMSSPEYLQKTEQGPVALLTVMKKGPPSMGPSLVQWFLYSIVVGIFAAYLAGRALPPGAEYLEVFRFTGTAAFLGYALALWQASIWFGRQWSTTLKSTLDGLIYGLLTAGVFGWLWPG
jgi:hypothetical protein